MTFQLFTILRLTFLAAAGTMFTAAAEFPVAPLAAAPLAASATPNSDPADDVASNAVISANDAPGSSVDRPALLSTLVAQTDVSATIYGERECLARAVYFEARGEPLNGQLAVAQVILNRVASGRFAATVCGVINQPGQFSFRNSRTPDDGRDWRIARAIATIAATGGWDVVAPRATAFHATRINVSWASMHKVGTIGNHVFYR